MNYSWYTQNSDINSPDTIHQILAYGSLDDIQELKKTIGEEKLRSIFITYPKKVYIAATLNFIKNFILNIHTPVDDQKYLKNTPRSIG